VRYEKSVRRILLLFAYFLVAISQSLKPEILMDQVAVVFVARSHLLARDH